MAALLEAKCPVCGRPFGEIINQAIGTTGEAIRLRRFKVIKAGPRGLVCDYIHAGGRMGVLLELDAEKPGEEARTLARDLAMHVAAVNPLAIKVEHLPE